MWSFFSRDSTKDFPYEILENVAGNTVVLLKNVGKMDLLRSGRDLLEVFQYLCFEEKSIWSLKKGKRKGSDEQVSIFCYEIKTGSEAQFELAKSSLKRIKTLRHPSVLQYLDSFENDKVIYVATEYVEPLGFYLDKIPTDGRRDLYLAWTIFQITRALSFLNNDGSLRHNNVSIWSVFVNASGEWKLGGLEYVQAVDVNNQHNQTLIPIKIPPALEIYDPPEKNDPAKVKNSTKCSTDMWGLGCLVWESFNGPLRARGNLKDLEHIPKSLAPIYCELVGANPSNRPNPADIITRCRKPGGFFKNELVDTLLFLEEIQIKDKAEKNRFFNALAPMLDNFPDTVCRHKILPQLITAYEYGDAGSAVLGPLFKLGRLLDEVDYQKRIVPCVVKLFASTDRVTRSRLLQQLELFVHHLTPAVINDQIFPQVAHGFLDTNGTIREQTVKSIIHLAPKLNYNNLNVEVLRHFARLQSRDEQGGIRTNTTVCLGKIAQHLHPQVRQRVLVSAFIRAMRDPFPPSRVAGILALAATQQYFLLSEVANRILPALCPLTADPEKSVRDPAFKTIRGFLGKLERVSEDPTLRESMEADVHTATPTIGNAAVTWAGWAVSAVSAKFYRSQSDTARPLRPPLTGRNLSKPASLEQPSSSSISTTTSSVTSMTSLEHESNDTSVSASDYGADNWDQENWGDMDTSQDPSSPLAGPTSTIGANLSMNATNHSIGLPVVNDIRDGWDNDEWGSLEEEPAIEELEEKENNDTNHLVASRSNSNSHSNSSSGVYNNNIVNNISPSKNNGSGGADEIMLNSSSNSNSNWDNYGTSWNDDDFEPIEDGNGANSKFDEARRKREEKKLQRQREMEARRAARAGPMKLGMGAKKL